MVKRMLIDATHLEETRVVVLDGTRLEEFDVETSTKKQNKGNIYLAKVIRVEPSLQAAFVDYGGNRHGFLAFSEIHPDYYQIPVADRRRLLADVHLRNDEDEAHGASAEDYHEQEDNQPNDLADTSTTKHENEEESISSDTGITPAVPLEFTVPAITSDINESSSSTDDPYINETEPSDPSIVTEPPANTKLGPSNLPVDRTSDAPASKHNDDGLVSTEAGQSLVDDNAASAGSEEATPSPTQAAKAAGVEIVGGEDEYETDDEDHKRRRFLASRHYKIQEVIKRRQIMLVQVVKEERGNKGAALTSILSLAGRYCVLMPNSARGGGVSRKITSVQDRRRLKAIVGDLELPKNMAVILRTAGAERNKAEIKRDYEYLQRTWNNIREVTMTSRAPALIHEEASLIKRAIRDIYTRDIEEVWVGGEEGYKIAKDFMKMLTPSHAKKVRKYKDVTIPLFHRYQVEAQLEAINNPSTQLKSGGSIVFAQTEALVAIDVNSGRSTKERHIEETAYRTNLEAAEEIARQLRLRDLAGLVVIDFIDMDENRNNHAVERRLKEALRADRARIQVGRISHFGLLELSRQRLRPSLIEANFSTCTHCTGTGLVRSTESAAVHSLRVLEEEGVRHRSSEITITVQSDVALYLLNYKREALASIQARYGIKIFILGDTSLVPHEIRLARVKAIRRAGEDVSDPQTQQPKDPESPAEESVSTPQSTDDKEGHRTARSDEEDGPARKRRRRRRRRREPRDGDKESQASENNVAANNVGTNDAEQPNEDAVKNEGLDAVVPASPRDEQNQRGRRRGRRGGRRRRNNAKEGEITTHSEERQKNSTSSDSLPSASQDIAQQAASDSTKNKTGEAPDLDTSTNTKVPPASDKSSTDTGSSSPSRLIRNLWKRGSVKTAQENSPSSQQTTPKDSSPPPKDTKPSTTTPPRRGWWQNSGES
ncbi:MAG: ribonuclease E/G [Candidatus Marinimicrobia bacterium]|nr:ribonuclease E/G [Candidatus Neomarinimicrobiota bacterium]